ncbi:MAG: hypothetical protein K2X81_06195, partial [Candidatus Obscuribacterales bacterium]|nr:hypothetical protein [Candidatus Obscuribacterales bacterium]
MPVNQKAYASKGSSSTVAGTNYSVAGTLAWFVVVGVSYVVLLMILAGPHFFGHHIKVGDTVEQAITAPKRSLIVDEDKTQDLRECARHSVMPVLKRDDKKSAAILAAVLSQLEKLKQMQAQGILPLDEPPVFSADEQVFLIELPDAEFGKFASAVKAASSGCPISGDLAESVLAKLRSLPQSSAPAKRGKSAATVLLQSDYIAKLTKAREQYQKLKGTRSNSEHKILFVAAMLEPEDLKQYCADVSSSVKRLLAHVRLEPYAERNEWELQVFEFLPDRIQDNLRHATADLVSSQFEPNVSPDSAATDKEMKSALAAVKPVMKEIEVGTVIVAKGQILDASDVKTLETVGITQVSDPGLAAVIAIALFAAFLLFGVYLYTYEPKLFFSPSAVALMATVSIITCTLALFIGPQYPQFVPLSATTLILAVTYK